MKHIYPRLKTPTLFSLLTAFSFLFSQPASAQTYSPGQAAKFGIDGDLRAEERQTGSFVAAGSHDWFKSNNGTGTGLIDTTGAASLKTQIMGGANIAFTKKMEMPMYSIQDGVLLMDATYARDYTGKDKTAFQGNNTKTTTDPANWSTTPNGSNVSDKTDIIDAYVSMRRNGTAISSLNPSNLIATMALTTLATNGDHYADFEFYKQSIAYNSSTGKFENSGPAATGGHSLWEFNADGSIKSWGDLTIGFSFNSSVVSDVKILIWVPKSVYNTVNPKNFDFVANEFYESTSATGYGYAAVKPNDDGQVVAWGTVNSAATAAPAWGSNSKDLGSVGNNYYSASYSAGQLAEAGVDLTLLGIDPVMVSNGGSCASPFARLLIKSRSSSSFSSALSDFAGPYEFMDDPALPASISNSVHLSCAQPTLRLAADGFVSGGVYNWTTANGSIAQTAGDNSSVEVSKAGTYYLTTAVASGCAQTVTSVVVTEDGFKPKAMAAASSIIISQGQSVTLLGGDAAASDYATPFGGSAGLRWQWDGVNGTQFASNLQNAVITEAGTYRLVLTELRNGCTDTAFVSLSAGIVLPVTFTGFTATADKQSNRLAWQVANAADVDRFEVEKSSNGIAFNTAGYVFADAAHTAYSFADGASGQTVYYRIKAVQKSGASKLSAVAKVESNGARNSFAASTDASGVITVRYQATVTEKVAIRVVNMNGQVVREATRNASAGANAWQLTELTKPIGGMYVVILTGSNGSESGKISW